MTRTITPATVVTATLACGHVTTVEIDTLFSTLDHLLDCFACDAPREWLTFASVDTGYNLRCRDCRYRRTFGNSRLTCQVKASSHAVRKAHDVEVRLDTTVLYLSITDTPSMFQDQSNPPF